MLHRLSKDIRHSVCCVRLSIELTHDTGHRNSWFLIFWLIIYALTSHRGIIYLLICKSTFRLNLDGLVATAWSESAWTASTLGCKAHRVLAIACGRNCLEISTIFKRLLAKRIVDLVVALVILPSWHWLFIFIEKLPLILYHDRRTQSRILDWV